MALKSSLSGEACYGTRGLPLCSWNGKLIYYEKEYFMGVSLPHLILWSFLQVLQGGNTLNFRFKHMHVFIPLKKNAYYFYVLLIVMLKNTLAFSHLKFQNRGLNLHAQNCRQMLTRQRHRKEMEEAGGITKMSSVGCCTGWCENLLGEVFVLRFSALCFLESWLLRMRWLTVGFLLYCWKSLKWGKEQQVVIVLVNNIILIIVS